MPKGLLILCACLVSCCLQAQNPSGMIVPADSLMKYRDTSGQRDIIEVLLDLTHIRIKKPPHVDGKKVYYSLLPLGTSILSAPFNSLLQNVPDSVFFIDLCFS